MLDLYNLCREPHSRHYADARLQLNTFTGINNVTASAIVAEIGDVARFTSADKLAKYAGLTPSQMSSGGTRNQR